MYPSQRAIRHVCPRWTLILTATARGICQAALPTDPNRPLPIRHVASTPKVQLQPAPLRQGKDSSRNNTSDSYMFRGRHSRHSRKSQNCFNPPHITFSVPRLL
ncbi:hypothetical protein BDW66DRAFT_140941, partial [Aspergillus desertorum]